MLVKNEVLRVEMGTAPARAVPHSVEDADDMARVLRDRRLHEFIGGQPLTITELRDGHARLAAGPAEPDESWLNSSSAPAREPRDRRSWSAVDR
jgi:hypothetical protein